MIKRYFGENEPEKLPEKGAAAQKIRALFRAYGTKYDFCRFYESENAVIAQHYGDFIVCDNGTADISEIAGFLGFCGFSGVFAAEKAGKELSELLGLGGISLNLMRFSGKAVKETPREPPLDEAFDIIKSGFDIDFSSWYADMSHFIRHGISRIYALEGSALCVQYDINGEALLSQIATKPEERGKGLAARLIKAVCGELSSSEVFVLCEEGLVDFYKKVGFMPENKYFQLQNNK